VRAALKGAAAAAAARRRRASCRPRHPARRNLAGRGRRARRRRGCRSRWRRPGGRSRARSRGRLPLAAIVDDEPPAVRQQRASFSTSRSLRDACATAPPHGVRVAGGRALHAELRAVRPPGSRTPVSCCGPPTAPRSSASRTPSARPAHLSRRWRRSTNAASDLVLDDDIGARRPSPRWRDEAHRASNPGRVPSRVDHDRRRGYHESAASSPRSAATSRAVPVRFATSVPRDSRARSLPRASMTSPSTCTVCSRAEIHGTRATGRTCLARRPAAPGWAARFSLDDKEVRRRADYWPRVAPQSAGLGQLRPRCRRWARPSCSRRAPRRFRTSPTAAGVRSSPRECRLDPHILARPAPPDASPKCAPHAS